eukprot:3881655-Prymnesium_polylepis.1
MVGVPPSTSVSPACSLTRKRRLHDLPPGPASAVTSDLVAEVPVAPAPGSVPSARPRGAPRTGQLDRDTAHGSQRRVSGEYCKAVAVS